MKQEQSKRLTILVPETLVEQFQKKCAENYKTMSEALRDFIKQYIKEEKWACILINIDWTQHQNKKCY